MSRERNSSVRLGWVYRIGTQLRLSGFQTFMGMFAQTGVRVLRELEGPVPVHAQVELVQLVVGGDVQELLPLLEAPQLGIEADAAVAGVPGEGGRQGAHLEAGVVVNRDATGPHLGPVAGEQLLQGGQGVDQALVRGELDAAGPVLQRERIPGLAQLPGVQVFGKLRLGKAFPDQDLQGPGVGAGLAERAAQGGQVPELAADHLLLPGVGQLEAQMRELPLPPLRRPR